jgi:hypothetical protein
MFSGVGAIIAVGLSRGILFRGAFAIGDYIESENAVLGPAVIDAAQWFEMPDMFSVIATPNAMFAIERVLALETSDDEWPVGARESMGVAYDVPLKSGKVVRTNAVDWTFSAKVRSKNAWHSIETWFFTALKDNLVSPDVEAKYRNSLEFLRFCEAAWQRKCSGTRE